MCIWSLPPAQTQAEVVLCLKGGDATLAELFALLSGQSHRCWHLRVVVHSKTDPAWDIVTKAISAIGRNASWCSAVVETLEDARPATGSLKCAALRQAYSRLHPETAVVVGVDGDAAIQPDWLIRLIAEVQQPGVGAASGNRWYEPAGLGAADSVRSVWGGAGIAVMNLLQVPWGGSLAVRREVIESSGWLKALETSFCEDTALPRQLWASGWRFVWVPASISVELGSPGDLLPTSRWIARQMLCAHMHHPLFWFTMIPFGILSGVAPLGMLLAAVVAAATGAGSVACTLAFAFVATELGCIVLVTAAREVVRRLVIRPLGIQLAPGATARWVAGSCMWVLMCQMVTLVSSIWCIFATSVEWRGVVYRRTGHQHIHIESMEGDKPVRTASMRASLTKPGSYLWASFAPSAAVLAAAVLGSGARAHTVVAKKVC